MVAGREGWFVDVAVGFVVISFCSRVGGMSLTLESPAINGRRPAHPRLSDGPRSSVGFACRCVQSLQKRIPPGYDCQQFRVSPLSGGGATPFLGGFTFGSSTSGTFGSSNQWNWFP